MITWNTAYESEPTNSTYVFELDNKIRELKEAIRERLEKEHVWKTGSTDGQHIPGNVRVLLVGTKAAIIASSGFGGAFGFASDTKELLRCTADGIFWSVINLDHASFSGIVDDDHTIYLKADGTRALTGDISAGSKKITNLATPTASGDLARKKYVDDEKNSFSSKVWLGGISATSQIYVATSYVNILTLVINIVNLEDEVFLSGNYAVIIGEVVQRGAIGLWDGATQLTLGIKRAASVGPIVPSIGIFKTSFSSLGDHTIYLKAALEYGSYVSNRNLCAYIIRA